jgi:hypothetical protein
MLTNIKQLWGESQAFRVAVVLFVVGAIILVQALLR